jgi:hypothetical protein
MNEGRLEYTIEGVEVLHIGDLEGIREVLKGIHVESELSEDKIGVYEAGCRDLSTCGIDELEEKASYIVDHLRKYEGILDFDYELGGEYPIELIIIFE